MSKETAMSKGKETLEHLQEELAKIKEIDNDLRGFHNEGNPLPSNLEIKDTDSGYTVRLSLKPGTIDMILRLVEREVQNLKGDYEDDIQDVKDALERLD